MNNNEQLVTVGGHLYLLDENCLFFDSYSCLWLFMTFRLTVIKLETD